jgi:hypothetical protein
MTPLTKLRERLAGLAAKAKERPEFLMHTDRLADTMIHAYPLIAAVMEAYEKCATAIMTECDDLALPFNYDAAEQAINEVDRLAAEMKETP